MTGNMFAMKIALALCISLLSYGSVSGNNNTNTDANNNTNTDSSNGANTTRPDLTLTATADDISRTELHGLHKDFEVECSYNRTDKSHTINVISMKLVHKAEGGGNFEDVAAIKANFDGSKPQLQESGGVKRLNAQVSGYLSTDGSEETNIKLKWNYPKEPVAGEFKCTVTLMDHKVNTVTKDDSITITTGNVSLEETVKAVIRIDTNLDTLKDTVSKWEVARNRIFTKVTEFKGHTYHLSNDMWTNHLAASIICQRYNGYLVEINNDKLVDWGHITDMVNATDAGNVLVGAKKVNNVWRYFRAGAEGDQAFTDMSSAVNNADTTKNCMTLTKDKDTKQSEGWKTNTIKCQGLTYTSFICEEGKTK